MTEPFFAGSASGFPAWPGNPWFQQLPFQGAGSIGSGMTNLASPAAAPGTPFTPAPVGVQAPSIGPLSGFPPVNYGVAPPLYALTSAPTFAAPPGAFPGYGIPPSWSGWGQSAGAFGAGSPFGGQEIPGGVPAAALVAMIATRRGQPMGPTSDREVEEVIYDALELLAGTNEVEARCEGGRVTLTGSVSNKRIKRDVGELAWAIPSVADVQNNVTLTTRRRGRHDQREEAQPVTSGRKQA